MALKEHPVEWKPLDDESSEAYFDGDFVAGLDRWNGLYAVNYGTGFSQTRTFDSEAEAKRWVAIHAPDLADPDSRDRL